MSTAAIVPSWITALKAAPGSGQPARAGITRTCPVDEIGRNSVSPCTMPSRIAWNQLTCSVCQTLPSESDPHESGSKRAQRASHAFVVFLEPALGQGI